MARTNEIEFAECLLPVPVITLGEHFCARTRHAPPFSGSGVTHGTHSVFMCLANTSAR